MGALGQLGLLWAAVGIDCCCLSVLLLFNIYSLVSFMREDREERASSLSMAAWAIGFISPLLGPCAVIPALLAMVLAGFERKRIYQEKSPLASSTPARMGSINGNVAVFLWLVLVAAGILQSFTVGSVPTP